MSESLSEEVEKAKTGVTVSDDMMRVLLGRMDAAALENSKELSRICDLHKEGKVPTQSMLSSAKVQSIEVLSAIRSFKGVVENYTKFSEDIHNMEVGSIMTLGSVWEIMKVPGGWLYTRLMGNNYSVFVKDTKL